MVVGHSFGGAVAAWLAATEPERVRALVLAAPSANRGVAAMGGPGARGAGRGVRRECSGARGSGVALAARPLRVRVARDLDLEERYLRSAGRILVAPRAWWAFFLEQRLLVRDLPMLEARLDRITAPAKVVIGTADRIVPVSSARRLVEQLPNAELIELGRANHLLPQQRAERLAEIVLDAYEQS